MRTRAMNPDEILPILKRRILVDGFDLVLDLERSQGSRLFDARSGKEYLDFFTFFATNPVGMNHPHMLEPEFMTRLAKVAVNKISNSDVYTDVYAEFVATLDRVGRPESMKHFFFVEGGALAVENGLKTAFDWKVRRNFKKGHKQERGHQIMHLEWAFHGRSGYTLSLTNTDPRKTNYFPKFDWPRIPSPAIRFPLDAAEQARLDEVEAVTLAVARRYFEERQDEIAAIITEPIQSEGGDNHFRSSFLQGLRRLADEFDALLIFDEVQTGVGMTGKFWGYQNFGVEPDVIAFAKKMQLGGIMAGGKVDEEPENVFRMPSRINSTWGAHIVDMLRATRLLEIIERDNLVENAARMGQRLLAGLHEIATRHPRLVSNVRGRGLLCAFSFPDAATRNAAVDACHEDGLLILTSGAQSLRFRPALNISAEDIDEGLNRLDNAIVRLSRHGVAAV
ncbi:MAG: L-lysine 6-transaminase [Acidobacteriota bacterium]